MVKVINKNGTAGKTPPFGNNWLDFWEIVKEKKAGSCKNSGCTSSAKNGGHVTLYKSSNDEYIVPICDSCNNTPNKVFEVEISDLVKINDWK